MSRIQKDEPSLDLHLYNIARRRKFLSDAASVSVAIVSALLLAFLIIALTGKNPVEAFEVLITGPLQTSNRVGAWLQDSTTLLLLGLSFSIPLRAGQISIGAEGQMYGGALASVMFALSTDIPAPFSVLAATFVGVIAGGICGFIPGYLKVRFSANEIVSTLMLNVIIAQAFDYLVQNVLRSASSVSAVSDTVDEKYTWKPLSEIFERPMSQSSIGVFVSLISTYGVYLLFSSTVLGNRMQLIGSNSLFAKYIGINANRAIIWSFFISGCLAGLAGAHLSLGVFDRLEPGMVGFYGFLGILVCLLGRNNPAAMVFAALFYSYLNIGARAMEQETNVSSQVIVIVQAVIVLLVTAKSLPSLTQKIRLKAIGR